MLGKIGKAITKTNDIVTRAASLLVFPMMLLILGEAFVRLVFWSTLRFAYDLTWMSVAAFVFLSGGYALSHDVHVKADIFYNMLNRRVKRVITFFCYIAFFFAPMAAILYSSFRMLYISIVEGEYSHFTPWAPPLWPIRIILCFGFVLLMLQGIVKFAEFVKGKEGESS